MNLQNKVQKLKDKIKKMRQCGLEKNGQYSIENLAFKALRRNGYLEKLSKIGISDYDKKHSIKENFFDLNAGYKKRLNTITNKGIKIDVSKLTINDNNKIKIGYNKIYINNIEVGSFVIEKIGDIKDIHNNKLYKNSIFLEGGFIIKNEYRYSGIGRKTIQEIFNSDHNLENIFLYAVGWQGAVDFWLKIGGEVIFKDDKKDLYFIKINKNNIENIIKEKDIVNDNVTNEEDNFERKETHGYERGELNKSGYDDSNNEKAMGFWGLETGSDSSSSSFLDKDFSSPSFDSSSNVFDLKESLKYYLRNNI